MLKFSNLTGKFSSSFELLPSNIPRVTGHAGGSYDIIGPFQRFVELPQNEVGVCRLACVGTQVMKRSEATMPSALGNLHCQFHRHC